MLCGMCGHLTALGRVGACAAAPRLLPQLAALWQPCTLLVAVTRRRRPRQGTAHQRHCRLVVLPDRLRQVGAISRIVLSLAFSLLPGDR